MENIGVFIPNEFYKDKNLKGMERDVLALYKYYTENGKYKCCSLNNTQIADILNVSTRYLRMVKKHLCDLGYIKTDGGIKVTYIGLQVGSTVPTQIIKVGSTVPQVGSTVPTNRKHSSYQIGSTVPIKQEAQFLHKEEKKEKENKKEEKRGMTNFDILIDKLPSEYNTQEKIDYIKDYITKNELLNNKLNDIDLNDGGISKSWVDGIKTILDKRYPPKDYHIKKEEVKSNTIDIL